MVINHLLTGMILQVAHTPIKHEQKLNPTILPETNKSPLKINGWLEDDWVVKLQTFLEFAPLFGEDEPILTIIFFRRVETTR